MSRGRPGGGGPVSIEPGPETVAVRALLVGGDPPPWKADDSARDAREAERVALVESIRGDGKPGFWRTRAVQGGYGNHCVHCQGAFTVVDNIRSCRCCKSPEDCR